MKEKIYTIPVTEVFKEESECPMCLLEKKLETQYIEYILGPSLMEPDCRAETNEKGFCRHHIELLYNKQENRLGLGLMLDTHLAQQNAKLLNIFENGKAALKRDSEVSALKVLSNRVTSRQTETDKTIDEFISFLSSLEDKCVVCSKLEYTMDRYTDVILYLWVKEAEFRELFNHKKGFCLKHLKLLLAGTKKYLDSKERAEFVQNLMDLQLPNMERIQKEVNWFTKKFDYRNNDAPWGDSRDALPRTIQKIAGFSNLK
jgi:hypothetical protein